MRAGRRRRGMPVVAFVVNRTLVRDPRGFLRRCRRAAGDRGWKPWFAPTSEAEDGLALTRRAVAAGASLVFAAGGDGTVRACAEALAGTGVPLAIVPLGTANLTARALGVPTRAERALDAGFDGRDRRIDLALLEGTGVGRPAGGQEANDETSVDETSGGATEGSATRFAAMAGIGLDAAVVEAADEQLKRRLGWVAYAVSGVTRLSLPPRDFTVRLDDAEPLRRRARCVVVANAGLLPGGFTLLPGARLDDGLLDVGILAPRQLGLGPGGRPGAGPQPAPGPTSSSGSRRAASRSAPTSSCRGRSTARSSRPARRSASRYTPASWWCGR